MCYSLVFHRVFTVGPDVSQLTQIMSNPMIIRLAVSGNDSIAIFQLMLRYRADVLKLCMYKPDQIFQMTTEAHAVVFVPLH